MVVKEIEKSESPSADAEQSKQKRRKKIRRIQKPSEIPRDTGCIRRKCCFDALVEQMTEQDTFDEGSGLALHDVMEQAVEQGVDFNGAMEPGRWTTIKLIARDASVGSQQVTIEKVQYTICRLWAWNISYRAVLYFLWSVRATAYCINPAKPGPNSAPIPSQKLADNQALAKVCY